MMKQILVSLTFALLHCTLGLHMPSTRMGRRKIVTGAASALLLPSILMGEKVEAASAPPFGFERVEGIGNGFDMLSNRPMRDVDILYPPSLNGTWVCERRVISVEGDTGQAQGAWKLLGGTGDLQKGEKYYVQFVDLRRSSDGIIGLDGKKYYGDVFDRAFEIEERTGGGSVVSWDPRSPNTLSYERSSGGGAVELKVVQRTMELPSTEGWGSNELIRVTTKSSAFGSNFDVTYATRVQRRWRRGATDEGDRVVEGLEISKTYRVLDGIAGIETPTSTLKSTIRLTRTYQTRPKTVD